MSTTKRIICLANSRKLSGRCLAGKEVTSKGSSAWIRPVSDREKQEVSEYERQYEDGSDPKILDVIDIPLLVPQPKNYQQENWLLDPNYYWQKIGIAKWADLKKIASPISPLWIDGHSTKNGLNDKMSLVEANALQDSLRLVHVSELTLCVVQYHTTNGNYKRRLQGHFEYNSSEYHLWVTDPIYERKYFAQPDGEYKLGECFLTISIGEPFNNECYKLIAAIIERSGVAS